MTITHSESGKALISALRRSSQLLNEPESENGERTRHLLSVWHDTLTTLFTHTLLSHCLPPLHGDSMKANMDLFCSQLLPPTSPVPLTDT